MDSASARGSIIGDLHATGRRKLDSEEDDVAPVKKKMKTKLVDLFNRASICLMTPEDRMNVYLRIKPYTKNEDQSQKCIEVEPEGNAVVASAPDTSHSYKTSKRGLTKSSHKFTFSKIFNEDTSQKQFFNETMLDMTKDFISGQNSLIFSYGVTSSGKTYTIQGKQEDAGILPRCLDVIFNSISGKQLIDSDLKPNMFTDVIRLSPEEVLAEKKLKQRTLGMCNNDDTTVMDLLGNDMESILSDTTASSSSMPDEDIPDVENREREELKVDVEDQGKIRFSVWVSFAEIYNEQVYDLLDPMPRKKNARRTVLKLSDDRNGSPYIKGLKDIHVESADEAYRLLMVGQRNLQTASTRLNHCSSRSHCIFNIKIVRVADKDDPHVARVSMLSLCDLAGSERHSKTQATGDRLKEAGNINTSLMTLSRCIETLRHNQLHKETQKMVPFRDSKLTRLLQNFFNGSGRAAMVVNVSQCASMYDDTLHVFKFSAIAKQVKHIEKPLPPPPKPKMTKKAIPASQRPSIAWESREMQEDDSDLIEITEEDEEGDEEMSVAEMRSTIKQLYDNNKRLGEMVMEEIENASNTETRVRQEVTKAMMKQVVEIENTYSTLMKETDEDSQEMADERVQGVIDVYEKRMERIQRKVDEDDEWVSSLLYHQEQCRVKDRDAKIIDLEKKLEAAQASSQVFEIASNDDSMNIANSMLVETFKKRLEDATESCKQKDSRIEELESYVAEAGEVYNSHVEEIKELKEEMAKMEQEGKAQAETLASLRQQLSERDVSCVTLTQKLKDTLEKVEEMERLEKEVSQKLKSKDSTITTLEEETKELHGEIERLQEQMSQVGDASRDDLFDSSDVASRGRECLNKSVQAEEEQDKMCEVQNNPTACEKCLELESDLETMRRENVEELTVEKNKTHMLVSELEDVRGKLEEESKKYVADLKASKDAVESLKAKESLFTEELECLRPKSSEYEQICSEMDGLKKRVEACSDLEKEIGLRNEEVKEISSELEQLKLELVAFQTKEKELVEQIENLNKEKCEENERNEELSKKVQVLEEEKRQVSDQNGTLLEKVQELEKEITEVCLQKSDLSNKVQALEKSSSVSKKGNRSKVSETCIADMVSKLENKRVSEIKQEVNSMELDEEEEEDDDDSEIVFKPREVQTNKGNLEQTNTDLAVKLKDTEFANTALRSKLKREEEDFFKREQALIHGYSAEIENLKLDIGKLKCKVETYEKASTSGRSLRSKKKGASANAANISNMSMTSMLSDSMYTLDSDTEVFSPGPNKARACDSCHTTQSKVSIIEGELTTVQEQFVSLTTAYRQLQALTSRQPRHRFSLAPGKGGNQTNSFIQDVLMGTSKRGQFNASVLLEAENITDSVLEFEKEEIAIRLEEMMMRQGQQDQDIRSKEEAMKREMEAKDDAEKKLNDLKELFDKELEKACQLKQTLKKTETEKDKLLSQISTVEQNQDSVTGKIAEIHLVSEERDTLKMSVNNLEVECTFLKDEIKKSRSAINLSETKIEELNEKKEELEARVTCLTDKLLQLQDTTHKEMSEKSNEKDSILSALEKNKIDLAISEEHLKDLMEKQKKDSITLEKITDDKFELQTQLQDLKEQLMSKSHELQTKETDFNAQLAALKSRLSHGQSLSGTLALLEEELAKVKADLQAKIDKVETVEKQQQEQEAEFSQKLLALEKEKRAAERKLAEVRDREKELEAKFEERLTQLEQRLREEHQMSEKLGGRQEVETLRVALQGRVEEMEGLRDYVNKTKDLQKSVADLEKSLAQEKDQNKESQKSIQTLTKNLQGLKSEMFEFEDTMSQQEAIIKTQDEELLRLNSELDSTRDELDKFTTLLPEKETKIKHLEIQISKLDKEVDSLQQQESHSKELEKHDQNLKEELKNVEGELKKLQEELRRSITEKAQTGEQVERLEREKHRLQEEVDNYSKRIEKERWEMEKLEERLRLAEKRRQEVEDDVASVKGKQKSLEEDLETANKRRLEEMEARTAVETELKQLLKLEKQEENGQSKLQDQLGDMDEEIGKLKAHNKELQADTLELTNKITELRKDISKKEEELQVLNTSIKEKDGSIQSLEKDLQKQERLNSRNREEMENWKQERDECAGKLQQLISKQQSDNKQLQTDSKQLKHQLGDMVKDNAKLMKDNADLVKNTTSNGAAKDSVIADLKKSNNQLSIQMAQAQGMSPPPKMETPDMGYPNRLLIKEEQDRTPYLEVDATPPAAAKKGRKRANSLKATSSSVDPDLTGTPRKSLRPIEESNENSPRTPSTPMISSLSHSPSKISGRMVKLASDVLVSMSPLTRSGKKSVTDAKPPKSRKKTSIQAPFEPASFVNPDEPQAQNENDPNSTRRSSRRRTTRQK